MGIQNNDNVIAKVIARQYEDGEIRFKVEMVETTAPLEKTGLYTKYPVTKEKEATVALIELLFASASRKIEDVTMSSIRPEVQITGTSRSFGNGRSWIKIEANIIHKTDHNNETGTDRTGQ